APSVARRLGGAPFRAFDILTLYAFVRPARFCLPTPRGVAAALGLPLSDDPAQQALGLFQAAARLLEELGNHERERPVALAMAMTLPRAGWAWGPAVVRALGPIVAVRGHGLDVWLRLPELDDPPPAGAPGSMPVNPTEARWRLKSLLGPEAEAR